MARVCLDDRCLAHDFTKQVGETVWLCRGGKDAEARDTEEQERPFEAEALTPVQVVSTVLLHDESPCRQIYGQRWLTVPRL